MKSYPLVSIIITTKNEEKQIGRCLESLKKQNYPKEKIEIIVVDNFSCDKTKIIAKNYTSKVYTKGGERSVQRNFGIKKAKGKYIFYLDADMSLATQLIKQAVLKLENSNLAALYIPEIIIGNSYWARVRNFERSFYTGTVIDAVRFIKKPIFIKAGGFDESLTGPEDWDLDKRIRKIGQTAILNKPNSVIYHHQENLSLISYLKKKNYYAKSFRKYIKKWGKNDGDIKKQFGFKYRYFEVFWKKNKWKKLCKQPLLTLGMYFLKLLIGFQFLKALNNHE